MKIIGLTQKVFAHTEYKERLDALDQRWCKLLLSCNLLPIILPNNIKYIKKILKKIIIDGVILTGGNTLAKYKGDAKERDTAEYFLLEYTIKKNLPLLGVCRGMQIIQDYFGVALTHVTNHACVKHKINFLQKNLIINSYHCYGAHNTNKNLKVLARSDDKVIEAVKHFQYNITGIMWHPERINPFCIDDKTLLKKIFYNDKSK